MKTSNLTRVRVGYVLRQLKPHQCSVPDCAEVLCASCYHFHISPQRGTEGLLSDCIDRRHTNSICTHSLVEDVPLWLQITNAVQHRYLRSRYDALRYKSEGLRFHSRWCH
jgi:hypothetical protein